jgi:hypothetical protein
MNVPPRFSRGRDHNAGEKKKFHSQRQFPFVRVFEAADSVLILGRRIHRR